MLSDFVKYVKQYWHDRPDKSTPLNADRLNHIENGIEANANAIDEIAKAVVNNIVNDPDKIASMAAVYALQEKLGTGDLPSDAPDVISAINTLNSNINDKIFYLGPNKTKTWTLRAPSFLMIGASNTTAGLLYILSNSFVILSKLPNADFSSIKISVSDYQVTITNPQDWGINVIMLYT